MRNSGNYNYALSFFGKDFNPNLYTCLASTKIVIEMYFDFIIFYFKDFRAVWMSFKPWRSLTAYSFERLESLFKSSIYAIKICDQYLWQFGNCALFGNVVIPVIFSSYFIINFDWKSDGLIVQIYSDLLEYMHFKCKKYIL